ADDEAHHRVRLIPAGREYHHGADGNSDGPEDVCEHVAERCLDVQAAAPGAGTHGPGSQGDAEAEQRDREHPAAERIARVSKPHGRLDEDPYRERDEEDAVRESSEDLGTLVAV